MIQVNERAVGFRVINRGHKAWRSVTGRLRRGFPYRNVGFGHPGTWRVAGGIRVALIAVVRVTW
jgi:hypothetical protein